MYEVYDVFEMFNRLVGNQLWLSLFLAALLYAFLRGSKAQKTAMITAIAVFFLFINNHVLRVLRAMGKGDVFYRNLWIIPIMTVIWLAFVDLFRRWRYVVPRVLMVAGALAALYFAESPPPLLSLAASPLDTLLVSEDVAQLSRALDSLQQGMDKRLVVLCPGSLTDPLTLYNGKTQFAGAFLVTKEEQSGDEVLAEKKPDVDHILSRCCASGVDYVIVPRQKRSVATFKAAGHKPVFRSDGYVIYACEGYQGMKQDFNQWGQVTWQAYHDAEGNPTLDSYGFSKIRYYYDSQGELTSVVFFDLSDLPVVNIKGYCETRYAYNAKRQLVRESYYGTDGRLIIRNDVFYAIQEIDRDRKGRIIAERYLDVDGKPVLSAAGYAAVTRFYDKGGHVVSEMYYGTDGLPINIPAGYASFTRVYDETGNIATERYFNAAGNPVDGEEG